MSQEDEAAVHGAATDRPPLAADLLVENLLAHGINRVFICPGSTEAAFLHAVATRPELEVVLTTHESIAVSMADGLARETGRPTAAYLHANVGLTNGLSHLYAAQLARSPVVVLTGLKETQIQGRNGFTTSTHIRDFVRQYTKWDWQSLRGADIAYDVTRAIQVAGTVPSGPTWVGLPQDLLESSGDLPVRTPESTAVSSRIGPDKVALARVVDLLGEARRPMIVAGADVARAGATAIEDLGRLAEVIGAPVLCEDRRAFERTALPTMHPSYAGMYDPHRSTVAEADLTLFLGTRFLEFEAPRGTEPWGQGTIVHVHSDPSEIARIYGVQVGLVADSGAFLRDLLRSVPTSRQAKPDFRDAARAESDAARTAILAGGRSIGLTVAEVVSTLSDTLDDDVIVVGDATTSGKALIHAVERTPATMHTTSSGSLGWGVGAAMGVKLGRPDKRVVGVFGDGAFQFGLQGLWTAARYRIPVVFLVVNNTAYAAVGAAIRRYAGGVTERERELVVDLGGPDLARIAQGFGIPASRVENSAELTAALKEAHEAEGPYVIEAMTDPFDLGP